MPGKTTTWEDRKHEHDAEVSTQESIYRAMGLNLQRSRETLITHIQPTTELLSIKSCVSWSKSQEDQMDPDGD